MLGLFLVLFLLLLVFKFAFKIRFVYQSSRTQAAVYFGLGTRFLRIPPSLLRKVGEKIRSRPPQSKAEALQRLRLIIGLLDRFVQELPVFELQLLLGLGDPFWTALGCGGLWALLGPLVAGLQDRFKGTPRLSVGPHYKGALFKVDFHCIFRFRLGQIILKEIVNLSKAFSAGSKYKGEQENGKQASD